MIDRSSLVAACLALLIFASLPAGAYVGASGTGSMSSATTEPQVEDSGILDSLGCLPSPTLEDISMNAHKQEATNLQTQSGTVSSNSTGPDDGQETFRVESGSIAASTICFSGSEDGQDRVELELNDVEFEDTALIGPWTDVEFEQGEADSMTVTLSPEAVLELLAQVPGSIDVIETIRDLFGIAGDDLEETDPAMNESDDGASDENGDPVENTTDEVDDTVDNTTDEIDDTVDNTTDEIDDTVDNTTGDDDTVDNTTGDDDTVDNTTDEVDDTVDNTTDEIDDTVDNTTGDDDDTVDNTTDEVDDTVDNTTDGVDDTVDNTTGVVDDTVDNTTDVVDDTIENTTGIVDDTEDNTTDEENDTEDNTTDVVDDTVDGATDVVDDTVDNTTDVIGGLV